MLNTALGSTRDLNARLLAIHSHCWIVVDHHQYRVIDRDRTCFPAVWGLEAESVLGADALAVNYLLRERCVVN